MLSLSFSHDHTCIPPPPIPFFFLFPIYIQFSFLSFHQYDVYVYHYHFTNMTVCASIYTLKRVTQHDFDRLYFFYPGFLFIKLDIPGKPVYLPFD